MEHLVDEPISWWNIWSMNPLVDGTSGWDEPTGGSWWNIWLMNPLVDGTSGWWTNWSIDQLVDAPAGWLTPYNNNIVRWRCHLTKKWFKLKSASASENHVGLTNWKSYPPDTASSPTAPRKCKYGRSLTVMPWTTMDEFKAILLTHWLMGHWFTTETKRLSFPSYSNFA